MATEYLLLDYLPDRQESCIQGAIEALNTGDPLVQQTVSSLEAPSAVAVVRTLFPGVVVEFTDVPEPDPRIPIRRVSTVLWRYVGNTALPAVDAPAQPAVQSVVAVARSKYNLSNWSRLAAAAARALDVTPLSALAVMVHPPDQEPLGTLWDWRFRLQVAAALLAGHLSERSGKDSVALLSDVVDGPIDWTTSAAIVALLDVAQRQPKRRNEIAELFFAVLKRPANPVWFMNCAHTAAVACRRIPGLPDGVYARLDQIIDQLTEPA